MRAWSAGVVSGRGQRAWSAGGFPVVLAQHFAAGPVGGPLVAVQNVGIEVDAG